jgi:hypothetical protein
MGMCAGIGCGKSKPGVQGAADGFLGASLEQVIQNNTLPAALISKNSRKYFQNCGLELRVVIGGRISLRRQRRIDTTCQPNTDSTHVPVESRWRKR